MTRDLELMRRVLFDVEAAPGALEIVASNDAASAALFRNVALLAEAGYLESENTSSTRIGRRQLLLTWRGHELLDAIRSEATWALLKERLPIASGEVPVHIVEQYAFHVATQTAVHKGMPMSP